MNKLCTINEVIELINQQHVLLLTGDEKTLKNLPKGKWIAGTGPYFMDEIGKISNDMIFVDDFTEYAIDTKIELFDETNIQQIAANSFENGFTLITLPIGAKVYYEFSNNSLTYDNIFDNPVVGYVSGCLFENIGKVQPKTANGLDGQLSDTKAAVMHIKLPDNLIARAEIFNFDTIHPNAPKITFPKTSFFQTDCIVDGKPRNIAEWFTEIKEQKGYYPQLITDINGALINRDVKVVDMQKKEVEFFSPVYEGDVYGYVKENDNYLQCFNDRLANKKRVIACLSCVSYFMAGKFEGRKVNFNGVYAFGEIGYQLLNKTIVTLELDEV